MRMYLTDYNPNGTNDLIITNGIKTWCIEEATFGFQGEFNAVMDEYGEIFEGMFDPSSITEPVTYLVKTNYSEVIDRLSCNPCDPSGGRKLGEIKAALRDMLLVKKTKNIRNKKRNSL